MDYQITQVTTKAGHILPAFEINGIFLANTSLTQNSLEDLYVKAVIEKLKTEEGSKAVKEKSDTGLQYLLPIGNNRWAPMTVRTNKYNDIIAILHFGPA